MSCRGVCHASDACARSMHLWGAMLRLMNRTLFFALFCIPCTPMHVCAAPAEEEEEVDESGVEAKDIELVMAQVRHASQGTVRASPGNLSLRAALGSLRDAGCIGWHACVHAGARLWPFYASAILWLVYGFPAYFYALCFFDSFQFCGMHCTATLTHPRPEPRPSMPGIGSL